MNTEFVFLQTQYSYKHSFIKILKVKNIFFIKG